MKGLYTNLQIHTNKADICAWVCVCVLFIHCFFFLRQIGLSTAIVIEEFGETKMKKTFLLETQLYEE